jgi:hypothetical protein
MSPEDQLRLPRALAERVDKRFWNHAPRGWWPLLGKLHLRLAGVDPEYKLAQVKEKFGALTIYPDDDRYATRSGLRQELERVVAEFQRSSSTVCEECGAAGKRHGDQQTGGRIRTLCHECAQACEFRPEWGARVAQLQKMLWGQFPKRVGGRRDKPGGVRHRGAHDRRLHANEGRRREHDGRNEEDDS